MLSYNVDLGQINGVICVTIEKKKIKNVHLKVYNDLSVKLSVPEKVNDVWVERFLADRKDWINKVHTTKAKRKLLGLTQNNTNI